MRFHRLRFENIREFDKLEFCFGDESPHHVSMIQMANGTGKTTTLELIRALLSQSGKNFSPDEIADLKPKKLDADFGRVDLTVSFDEDKYTLTLELDYQTGEHKYYTTSAAGKHGGRESGLNIPPKFFSLLEYVELFIFNGELVHDLLNHEKVSAKKAIDLLYGTRVILELATDARKKGFEIISGSNSTISKDQGLKSQRTILARLQRT